MLTKKVQGEADKVPVREFLKAVKPERKTISHRDDLPSLLNQSQIHAVCLQMIAQGLVALKVKDATKVGTKKKKLNRAHLCVVCPNARYAKNRNTLRAPAYLRDECSKGFKLD